MRLHTPLHFIVVEVLLLMDKGLTYLIQRCIVQVLGLKSRCINHCIAWIVPVNHVLFNKLHWRSSLTCTTKNHTPRSLTVYPRPHCLPAVNSHPNLTDEFSIGYERE